MLSEQRGGIKFVRTAQTDTMSSIRGSKERGNSFLKMLKFFILPIAC